MYHIGHKGTAFQSMLPRCTKTLSPTSQHFHIRLPILVSNLIHNTCKQKKEKQRKRKKRIIKVPYQYENAINDGRMSHHWLYTRHQYKIKKNYFCNYLLFKSWPDQRQPIFRFFYLPNAFPRKSTIQSSTWCLKVSSNLKFMTLPLWSIHSIITTLGFPRKCNRSSKKKKKNSDSNSQPCTALTDPGVQWKVRLECTIKTSKFHLNSMQYRKTSRNKVLSGASPHH